MQVVLNANEHFNNLLDVNDLELSKSALTTHKCKLAYVELMLDSNEEFWYLNNGDLSEIYDNYIAKGEIKNGRSPKGANDNTRGKWKIENKFLGDHRSSTNWFKPHELELEIEKAKKSFSIRFDVLDTKNGIIERYQMTASKYIELITNDMFDRKSNRQIKCNKTNKELIKNNSRKLGNDIEI